MILLFLAAVIHLLLGYQLYIHWLHRAILVIVLAVSVAITIVVNIVWSDGWDLMEVSLMISSPFLQVAAVVVMTLASWFIAALYLRIRSRFASVVLVRRIILMVAYLATMITLYLSPLAIRSPCVIELAKLPSKPLLLAHKGASSIPQKTQRLRFSMQLTARSLHSKVTSASASMEFHLCCMIAVCVAQQTLHRFFHSSLMSMPAG
jgi:magnesium-transporting ATPase (P-type)